MVTAAYSIKAGRLSHAHTAEGLRRTPLICNVNNNHIITIIITIFCLFKLDLLCTNTQVTHG